MKSLDDYLDLARKNGGFPSDNALSIALGSVNLVSAWRTKRAWPSVKNMRRLAEFAGEDPELAVLELETWREPDAADLFRSIIRKISAAAAVIVLLFALYPAGTSHAQVNTPDNSVYIMIKIIMASEYSYLAIIAMILYSFLLSARSLYDPPNGVATLR